MVMNFFILKLMKSSDFLLILVYLEKLQTLVTEDKIKNKHIIPKIHNLHC